MPKLLIVLSLLLACVSGCLEPQEDDEDMNAPKNYARFTPESWGQEKVFHVGQLAQRPQSSVVLDLPRQGNEAQHPRVRTMILSVENEDADATQEYFLRWVLRSGTGGARTEVVFDAVGFTRIALPAEQVTLSLASEPYNGGVDRPAGTVRAHAYIGDFGVGELEPGPTYTEEMVVDVAPNPATPGVFEIPLPKGANRFRVVGQDPEFATPTISPFRATTKVLCVQGNTVVCTFVGARTFPATVAEASSLLSLYYSQEFLPIPAGVSKLRIQNYDTSEGIFGFVQFGLDL